MRECIYREYIIKKVKLINKFVFMGREITIGKKLYNLIRKFSEIQGSFNCQGVGPNPPQMFELLLFKFTTGRFVH